MRVEKLCRVDADLADQLGVASRAYWLSELERLHVAQQRQGGEISYLVARDVGGTAVGMLPFYLAVPPFEPAIDPTAVFEPPVPVREPNLCVAGSPGTYANYLELSASVRGPEATRIAAALVEQACVLARAAGCSQVALPHLDEMQARWLDAYQAGATAVSAREKAVLAVAWDSFDGYLSWLPQRRRREVRRERDMFIRSGLDVREQRLTEVAAEVGPLMAQTENRYDRGVTPEQMEFYLMLLAMNLDDDCLTLVAYENDQPVAFSLTLFTGDRWLVRCWGCDYTRATGAALYFNLVYYEPIIRAIQHGAEMIDYGVGSLHAKKLRGCDLHELRSLLIPSAGFPSTSPEAVDGQTRGA